MRAIRSTRRVFEAAGGCVRDRRRAFSSPVLVLATGSAIGQGISFMVIPFITRLYAPSDFGVLSVATLLVGVLASVGTLRYEMAILLAKDEDDVAALVCLSTFVALVMVSLSAIGYWVWAGPLFRWLGEPGLGSLVPVLLLAQLFSSLYVAFSVWATRYRDYLRLAGTRVTQGAASAVTQLILGLCGAGAAGLVVGDCVGRSAGVTRLGSKVVLATARSSSAVTLGRMRRLAVRYRRFPLLSAPSALVNTAVLQMPPVLLLIFYGADTAGLYLLAQRICGAPVSLFGAAIAQPYVAQVASLLKTDPDRLGHYFLRTARRLCLYGAIPIVAASLLAPLVVPWLLGERWTATGVFVAVLGPASALQLMASPLGGTLDVLERQDLHLAREVARLVITGASVALAARLHWSSEGAVALLSIAMCLTYGLYIWTTWAAIRQLGARNAAQSSRL